MKRITKKDEKVNELVEMKQVALNAVDMAYHRGYMKGYREATEDALKVLNRREQV